jgi:two-component system, NarL family, response regulator NreC
MDVAMPLLNGIDAAEQIRKSNDQIAVVMLTMHADEGYLLRALNAGVRGYLLKESAEEDLLQAVLAVSQGKPFFSSAITQTLLEDYMRVLKQEGLSDTFELLTTRERKYFSFWQKAKPIKKWLTFSTLVSILSRVTALT